MLELLAPAGDFEKLKIALRYGADAIYLGGGHFSLRSSADNFSDETLKRAIDYAHARHKKVYVTANIIPRNQDIEPLAKYADLVANCGADALIVSDLGAFDVCRRAAPELPLHISTQANNVNFACARMWHELGASRIILARELSYGEVAEIRTNTPPSLELEMFVHGAMCVAYSGRCLLSSYMISRDANRGDCAQPCRWNYSLVEEKRPGEYLPVFENERGSFIFNSKDLCLIKNIAQIAKAGVQSLKIEGRVKSEYYVATVVKAYRREIDRFLEMGDNYVFDPSSLEELTKVSHREYSSGFWDGSRGEQVYTTSSYVRICDVVAVVTAYDPASGLATLEQRNKFSVGDTVEILQPNEQIKSLRVAHLYDESGAPIESVPHSKMVFTMPVDFPVEVDSFVRKPRDN